MRIFIKSCHGALEYDQAVMFTRMGYSVAGQFDVGGTQRPKVPGVTDVSYGLEDAFAGSDVILLHQCEAFPQVMEDCCKRMGKRPVILHAFGQGCLEQHKYVVAVTKAYSNAYVVSYSYTDWRRYLSLGMDQSRIRVIHFGKDINEFQANGGWTGKLPMCYMAVNSIQKRGEGCGWTLNNRLAASELPILVGGRDTTVMPNGIDALSYEGMKNMYRQVRCYFAVGTIPAPITLTPIEAMCCGTPVIAYDNGCGIVNEGLDVLIAKSYEEIRKYIIALTSSMELASVVSTRMIERAKELFDMEVVAGKWEAFISDMI